MGHSVARLALALLLGACSADNLGQVAEKPNGPDGTTIDTGDPGACGELARKVTRLCPGVAIDCPSESAAACILALDDTTLARWCSIESGGDICGSSGRPTAAYVAWCDVEACTGSSRATCLDEADACRNPPTGPSGPPPGDICQALENLAGHCPGYVYECDSYPEAASQCLYDLLSSLDDECLLFYDLPICGPGGTVTPFGQADCGFQECFGLTQADACIASYDAECDWVMP